VYEKFSKRVESVVKIAREIAREADQEYLGTEHFLLAIASEGTGFGAKLLGAFGVNEHSLKAELDRLVKKSMEETWVFGNLPGSPHLKSTVAAAIAIAQEFKTNEVCTEHLILAMLNEKGSVAQCAMAKFGMDFDGARDKLRELEAA
jgi:ATP-dependent Clp protease ATP-binding subunit ClpC